MRLKATKIIENKTKSTISMKNKLSIYGVQYLLIFINNDFEQKLWCGEVSLGDGFVFNNTTCIIKNKRRGELVYVNKNTNVSSYNACFPTEVWYSVNQFAYEMSKNIQNTRDFDVFMEAIEVVNDISEKFKKENV